MVHFWLISEIPSWFKYKRPTTKKLKINSSIKMLWFFCKSISSDLFNLLHSYWRANMFIEKWIGQNRIWPVTLISDFCFGLKHWFLEPDCPLVLVLSTLSNILDIPVGVPKEMGSGKNRKDVKNRNYDFAKWQRNDACLYHVPRKEDCPFGRARITHKRWKTLCLEDVRETDWVH